MIVAVRCWQVGNTTTITFRSLEAIKEKHTYVTIHNYDQRNITNLKGIVSQWQYNVDQAASAAKNVAGITDVIKGIKDIAKDLKR